MSLVEDEARPSVLLHQHSVTRRTAGNRVGGQQHMELFAEFVPKDLVSKSLPNFILANVQFNLDVTRPEAELSGPWRRRKWRAQVKR